VIVDDMISTAGTIEAAAQALLAAGCRREITVVASHALLAGPAVERLSGLPLKRLTVTDSLQLPLRGSLPMATVSLAPMLAETNDAPQCRRVRQRASHPPLSLRGRVRHR
jgi:ribose-phosphate pyrophosphokinase